MGSLKTFAVAGLLTALSVPALAADLMPAPVLAPVPVDVGGGWYLRGDVGVGALDLRRTEAIDVSSPPAPYAYNRLEDRVENQVFVGGGVGYQFNGWLRADFTAEYRFPTHWHLNAEDTTPGYATGGYNLTSGKFSSVVGLANAYLDLGTWGGVTPFIGAGIGFAHHMFGAVSDHGFGAYAGGYGYGGEYDKTSLAYAAHAGIAYSLSPNAKIEIAYRYLNMGDAQSGTVACVPGCSPDLRTVYRLKELESHDIKVALRWALGGPVAAPVFAEAPVMQAPIVRKY